MALKIIDARKSGFPHDGHFGYVHLIFDRDIEANPLRVSILKMIGREYLGESFPPKANWRPTRWHFFDAVQVARGDGESVFLLGPEVTSFIPDESMLEIASEDNAVREMAVWSGVSVDFSWKGPPPDAAGPGPGGNSGAWYYCNNPDGYYPYVKHCNSAWQAVPPTPPAQNNGD